MDMNASDLPLKTTYCATQEVVQTNTCMERQRDLESVARKVTTQAFFSPPEAGHSIVFA